MGMLDLFITLFICFLPIQFDTGMGFRLAPSDLFIAAAFVWLGRISINDRLWSFWHIALATVFTMGLLVAQIREGEVTFYAVFQKYIGLFVLFATYGTLVTHCSSEARIKRCVNVFVVSVILQNIAMMLLFVASSRFGLHISALDVGIVRLQGLLNDPNAYGGLLVTAFALLVCNEDFKEGKWLRIFRLFGLVTLSTGLLLTFSRSAWIGFAVVLGSLILAGRRQIVGVLTVIGVAACLVIYALSDNIESVLAMSARPDQIDVRVGIIDIAIEQFLLSPIVGIGLGTFTNYSEHIVHNTPLWFLTELGVIGLLAFAGFFLCFVQRGWSALKAMKNREESFVMGLLMAHGAVLGVSMGIEALYQRHWWLVMSLISASYAVFCTTTVKPSTVLLTVKNAFVARPE